MTYHPFMKFIRLFLGLSLSLYSYADNRNGELEGLVIPFLEVKLDQTGVLDNEIWKKAAKTSPFKLFKTGKNPQKDTYVQLIYDAKNLYLRFVCSHPSSEPLRTVINQETIDARVFADDCVEVFLTQGPEANLFHLASSARGVRYDDVNGKPEEWDGRWNVTALQLDDRWEATFIIPFDDLSLPGESVGTPVPGTHWWMNFARAESHFSEWSQWNPSERGFADRTRFRPMVFGDRPDDQRASFKVEMSDMLFAGRNKALIEVHQEISAPLLVTAKVEYLDRESASPEIAYRHRIEEPENERFSLEVPFDIKAGGDYRLIVHLEAVNKGLDLGVYSINFSAIDLQYQSKLLGGILDTLGAKLGMIQDSNFKRTAKQDLLELNSRLEDINQRHAEGINAESGKELSNELEADHQAAMLLQRSVQKKYWRENLDPDYPKAEFCIGISSPFEHIFMEDLFSGPINQKIRLQLARNESEAAQIVIIPLTEKDLLGVEVEVSPLIKAEGEAVIEPTDWNIGPVGYVEAPSQMLDEDDIIRRFWPDVCLPPGPFNISAETQRPVYLHLHIATDQAAGKYLGEIKVRVEDMTQTIPVEVDIWDFSLPEVPTLRSESWMRLSHIANYYSVKEVSLEQYERILKDFRPYRLSLYPFDYVMLARKIRLFREKDGSLTVDFSEFDPYIDLAIEYGANAINLNLGMSGMLTVFAGGFGIPYLTITDRQTGITSPYPAECRWPAEDLLEDPDFIAFWKIYWEHAKSKGWGAVAYVEDVDEPNDNSRKELLLKRYQFFRDHCPGLQLQSFGPTPSKFDKSIGLIDIWSPALDEYEGDANALQKRREAGDEIWIYTCGRRRYNSDGDYVPDTHIDRPLIGNRIPALMSWKFGAEGLFHFSFNSFSVHPDLMAEGKKGNWGEYPVLLGPLVNAGFGTFNLTWPGPEECQLLPSLRLEMIREGREDFEYLALLQRLLDQLRAEGSETNGQLIAQTKEMLSIPSDIVVNTYQWSRNPVKLMEWRVMVAQQILKCKSVLQ